MNTITQDSQVEQYYTRKEVSERLRISLSHVDKLARKGKLHRYKIGQVTLFAGSNINAYLQECANEPKI
ncbi:TPA: helix-turn-helix domain-containing protein [Mannheimia haemolytica]